MTPDIALVGGKVGVERTQDVQIDRLGVMTGEDDYAISPCHHGSIKRRNIICLDGVTFVSPLGCTGP